MQTIAMNSMFMAAGQSGSKASDKAGSNAFFGRVLSGRQATADSARQPFSAGVVKTTLPVEKATADTSFSDLQGPKGMSPDDLSQLQMGGAELDPAALKQLQTLLTKLTAHLSRMGQNGEALLAELDFSAVAQGLERFSGAAGSGRQLIEQLQKQLRHQLEQSESPAMTELLMEGLVQGDMPTLREQIGSVLEGADPASLMGQLVRLQQQLEGGPVAEQAVDISGNGALSGLHEQIGSVLEGADPAPLKDRLMRLQAQLEDVAVAEQAVDISGDGALSGLHEQIIAVVESQDPTTLKNRLGRLQEQLQDLNKSHQLMSQEEVSQLKKQLQQQINGLAQRLQQTSEAAGQKQEQSSRQNREELDSRFTSLIRPKGEQNTSGNQEALAQNGLKMTGNSNKAIESLLHQVTTKQQHQGQQGNIVPQVQGQVSSPQVATPAPIMPMSTGQTVADSQIFDQVVTRMAGSFNGESGRMTLRLHPAELGSLKLDLHVEGQTIRANLQAQTTQVQEVLERNLPQLRQALAEQGLKIDQFQVNLEQRQQGEQFADLQRHWSGGNSQSAEQLELQEEEQVVPLAHLLQNGGSGISLHV